jgi:hypothetical protein
MGRLWAVHGAKAGRISGCSGSPVVSCSRPGRASDVRRGRPFGAVMIWMFPSWLACLLDHHGSTPGVGAAVGLDRVPSVLMVRWNVWPAQLSDCRMDKRCLPSTR